MGAGWTESNTGQPERFQPGGKIRLVWVVAGHYMSPVNEFITLPTESQQAVRLSSIRVIQKIGDTLPTSWGVLISVECSLFEVGFNDPKARDEWYDKLMALLDPPIGLPPEKTDHVAIGTKKPAANRLITEQQKRIDELERENQFLKDRTPALPGIVGGKEVMLAKETLTKMEHFIVNHSETERQRFTTAIKDSSGMNWPLSYVQSLIDELEWARETTFKDREEAAILSQKYKNGWEELHEQIGRLMKSPF